MKKMDSAFGYWFLQIILFLLRIVDTVIDLLLGFTFCGGTKKERQEARRCYEKSAQLVIIRHHARYHQLMDLYDLSYYLYRHENYISPEYVLDKPNVALYFVNKTHAVFAVGEPDVDFYDTKKVPFCGLAFEKLSKKLFIIPMSSFHRLAEELGDPNVSVSIFGMTARCGSTLISQILNRVPNTRSMSEPWVFTHAYVMYNKGLIDMEEYR